ncbi:MAG: hypothetical protein HY470_01280 [Candidatus Ryanbacteria bacterium]|nr:hypothetical protein [Candidatus Ryanbacteria bacterium]
MEPKSRKYIVVLGVVLLLLVLLIFFIVLRSTKSDDAENTNGWFSGLLPDTGGEGPKPLNNGGGVASPPPAGPNIRLPILDRERALLVQLTNDPVTGAAVKYKDDKVVYFKRGLGNIFEIPFDGSQPEERIFHFTIPGIVGVDWSYKRNYALVTALGEDSLRHIWINVTSTSTLDSGFLPTNTRGASFSPTEDRLAIVLEEGTGSAIAVSDPKGRGVRRLASLPVFGLMPRWVSKNTIELQTKPSALSTTFLATVNAQTGAVTVLLSDIIGLDTMWNKDASKFLSLETKNDGRQLVFGMRSVAKPEEVKYNGSTLTLPEKCVFSTKDASSAYCAVPKEWAPATMPDAWWQGKTGFSDELWLVNFENESVLRLLSGGGFDMTNLFLSEDERYLFFTDKNDSTLWSFNLKD